MKQTVSAPVALLVILLVALVSVAIFSRPKPEYAEPEEVFVLPFEPSVDDRELQMVREGMRPLGIFTVMPPLASDRFQGARIALVMQGSPAAKGGLKPGDLVKKFNDQEVTTHYGILAALSKVEPDKPSTVVVERAGKELEVVITGIEPLSPEERRR